MADETRDIAVRAESMINQHMTDCTQFRLTVAESLREFREEFKKLNWRVALMLGGLIIISRGAEFIFQLLHKVP